MQSDRVRAAQLPFWPGLQKTAKTAKNAKNAKNATAAKGPRAPVPKQSRGPEAPAERAVRLRLQERMGARVALKNKQGRGSFTVHFTSYAELEEIMRRIDA